MLGDGVLYVTISGQLTTQQLFVGFWDTVTSLMVGLNYIVNDFVKVFL